MNNYKILGTNWYTPMTTMAVIGVVAIETTEGNWKAYIGYGSGADEEGDTQIIAANGSKIIKEAACGHFPHLNPEKFVY